MFTFNIWMDVGKLSWSFTVNEDNKMTTIPEALAADFSRAHVMYPDDMQRALDLARALYLKSFTCSGGRTVVPYTGEEYITVTVLGSPDTDRINESIRNTILRGPDDEAKAARDSRVLHENDSRR